MKKSRFTEQQIVKFLKEADAGAKVKDVNRTMKHRQFSADIDSRQIRAIV